MLELNLQLFAKDGPGGEKTEKPTSKKLNDARKDGQVCKSKEIGNLFALVALFLLLRFWAGHMGMAFMEFFSGVYNKIPEYTKQYWGSVGELNMFTLLRNTLVVLLIQLLPIMLIGFFIAFICDLVQVKWMISFKPMEPKFSKLNPINGFKRIFSLNSLVELAKSLLKVGIMFYMVYIYLRDKTDLIFLLYDIPLLEAIVIMRDLVFNVGIRICAAYVAVALIDYIYQKWKFTEDMKMTKQEVKDEYKESEGDPTIKGKQKQRMMEASRRRMMQSVPSADVVITNPTHYAVAIKYDPEVYDAPYCVAKGCDHLAAKIKEAAKENGVEIVENKPLARMLYISVEVGQLIPPELYEAVANVLAFVYNLKGTASQYTN